MKAASGGEWQFVPDTGDITISLPGWWMHHEDTHP
jgi:hypothetical protein